MSTTAFPFRISNLFNTPDAKTMAEKELEDAKRELLQAQTLLDYAKSTVTYQGDRVRRLTDYLRVHG